MRQVDGLYVDNLSGKSDVYEVLRLGKLASSRSDSIQDGIFADKPLDSFSHTLSSLTACLEISQGCEASPHLGSRFLDSQDGICNVGQACKLHGVKETWISEKRALEQECSLTSWQKIYRCLGDRPSSRQEVSGQKLQA
jgi:hypothetical protein